VANRSVEDYKRRLARVARAGAQAGYGALLQGAREIGQAMKAAVPRDKGTLADSIRLETDDYNGRVRIKAGGEKTTRPVRSGGPDYDYALGQEWGNSQTPAQPFFYPVWRLMRKSVRSKINREMKRAIEAEMGK
jgi:HK97 gp10 family phage protein